MNSTQIRWAARLVKRGSETLPIRAAGCSDHGQAQLKLPAARPACHPHGFTRGLNLQMIESAYFVSPISTSPRAFRSIRIAVIVVFGPGIALTGGREDSQVSVEST